MSKSLLIRLVAGTFALGGVWVAYTQNKQAPAAMVVNKVTDDLYELEQNGKPVADTPQNRDRAQLAFTGGIMPPPAAVAGL